MPEPVKEANVLPFTTGSPGMDSIVRTVLISISASVAGACTLWLNKRGYTDPSTEILIFGTVFGVLGTTAGGFWGWYQQHIGTRVVAQKIVAASKGAPVPAYVQALAKAANAAADKAGKP